MLYKKKIDYFKKSWNIKKLNKNYLYKKGFFISDTEIRKELKKFLKIYKNRPIKSNKFGIQFPHMFASYVILKKIKPKFVVESGVYKGQSTWLIERVLPKAKLLCLDPDLNNRKYISKKAKYSKIDFKDHDFSNIPENSLVFFDDHQHCMDRLIQAKWLGFKHIIFEDNYPWPQGDFYTLKKVILGTGFTRPRQKLKFFKIMRILKKIFDELKKIKKNYKYFIPMQKISDWYLDEKKPNTNDFKLLNKNIDIYFEFPPLFKLKKTAWGEKWSSAIPTKKPLLKDKEKNNLKINENELNSYNWICYIRFKKL
tara:strand:- start:1047 stop:1979 length:933 start_codon:yes stop_codon:yes gene_type:complete